MFSTYFQNNTNVFICVFFSDLSSEINRFEISLSNKTKKSKESDICKDLLLFFYFFYKSNRYEFWHSPHPL